MKSMNLNYDDHYTACSYPKTARKCENKCDLLNKSEGNANAMFSDGYSLIDNSYSDVGE